MAKLTSCGVFTCTSLHTSYTHTHTAAVPGNRCGSIAVILDFDSVAMIALDATLAAVIIGAFFTILLLIFKNSIGMGDIKLFCLMGLYLGLSGLLNAVFFSLLVSFFVSIAVLITKKKARNDTLAFGPMIFLGTLVSIIMTYV